MSNTIGIGFLYKFSVGNFNLNNPGANVLSVTDTAVGDFDKKNLTTTPLREVYRSLNVTGWKEIVFQTDFLTSVPNLFAILNHNISSTAVVQLLGSQTSDFLAPGFTTTIPYRKKHMILQQPVGQAYQYYKIRILDPSNLCGYLEIGRIVGGTGFYFTDDEDVTDNITFATDDLAYKMKTEGFFRAFNERVKVDKIDVRFQKLRTELGDSPNFTPLMEMLNTVGETYPFLTIVDPEDPTFPVIWGVLDRLPSIGYGINRYGDLALSIQEVY